MLRSHWLQTSLTKIRTENGRLTPNGIISCVGAMLLSMQISKGSRLYVEGSIRTRSWDGQDGSKKYVTEIVATHIQLTGKKENSSAPADTAPQRPQSTPLPPMGDDDDSDLPF